MTLKRIYGILTVSLSIALLCPAGAVAQRYHSGGGTERKKLVVTIVVDQLRSEQLELMRSRLTSRGFNRLLNGGAYIENMRFDIPSPDAASSTAIIFTGTYPNVNGIPSQNVYNTQTRSEEAVLTDRTQIGNFTKENFSPAALKVSTVADELRATDELSSVHAIAADPQVALIMAGHAGNSAFWISDANGNWASTTYYKLVPPIISQRNHNNPLSARIDTMEWRPSIPLISYVDLPESKQYIPFSYRFPKNDINRYRKVKCSPIGNKEVTDLAIDYINSLFLGRHSATDMLNIAYTVADYPYADQEDTRVETQDAYLRLDEQLARLLDAIDSTVGLKNALIVLTSTGYYVDASIPDERLRIPTGEFFPERALSLLNLYLMALYGNGQWVDTYYDKTFFLDRNLIKENGLDLAQVRAKSCEFLRQMTGVNAAYTFEEILNNPSTEVTRRMHRSMVHSLAADIFIEVYPGWKIVENTVGKKQPPKVNIVRYNAISTPCFIMADGIAPQRVTSAVDATALAPTMARLMHITPPNAAQAAPIPLQ